MRRSAVVREVTGLALVTAGLGLMGTVLIVLAAEHRWVLFGALAGGIVLAAVGRGLAAYDPVAAYAKRQEKAQRRVMSRLEAGPPDAP